MKNKRLLAIVFLGLSFCFVSGVGYGEKLEETLRESKKSLMEHYLLRARVNYIMKNPTNFLNVEFSYDPHGGWGRPALPETIDTKGKICVVITDNRDAFAYKSGTALLKEFKKALEAIYSSELVVWVIGLDTELVVVFRSKDEIPLGYFYQGEYHLWEK